MRTIDGTRYIAAKEYADIMGITVGRVSQLKAELPFVKMEEFGIEVINFDLLDLQLKEKTFAQTKFETSNPLHSYTYKDLGNFFSKFALDLVQFKGNAEMRIEELQNKNQELAQVKTDLERELMNLKVSHENLVSAHATLEETLGETNSLNDGLNERLNDNINTLKEVQEQCLELTDKNETLETINKDLKHDLEIKVLEQNTLNTEKESLKEKVSELNTQLNQSKEESNQKAETIKDLQAHAKGLEQTLEADKISRKELEHQAEIKVLERKTFETENQNLKQKVAELEKQLRNEKDLKGELNDLREKIENLSKQNSGNSAKTKIKG